ALGDQRERRPQDALAAVGLLPLPDPRASRHGGIIPSAGAANGSSHRAWGPVAAGVVGIASRSGGVLGRLDERAERFRLAHGDVGEDLAVELDARLAQARDEARVGHALLARGGVDA